MKRESWSSRATFILAAIGSAVGLGNAWRFPGMCAKFGGGAFLVAYIICMIAIGIPLLMMEIAIGRKAQGGAPKSMRLVNKKAEKIGWASTANAFVILSYYAVVFAWCILMVFISFRFATDYSTPEKAGSLWSDAIGTSWTTKFSGDFDMLKILLILCLIIAWGFIYGCIRNGASQVGKVVKFTVFIPLIMLLILAVKGFIGNPNLGEALKTLFVPKWKEFGDADLWVNAVGQAFYSLSIMMAIMFAYGSFLRKKANIAVDAIIIAFSDLAISVLSGIVLFTTMYSVGMTVNNMSTSGVATAFIIYPTAIVNLTDFGWLNAGFGIIFYIMLCTLAIDSAFSILEGVSTAVADKFHLPKRKTTFTIACIAAVISIIYITSAGVAFLDIVDNWTNAYTLIIVGILETIAVGWFFKPEKVLVEINKNTNKFKMPKWWFVISVKFIAPLALGFLFVWQVIELGKADFRYDKSYGVGWEIVLGWIMTILVFASGFIVSLVCKKTKIGKKVAEYEAAEPTWDEINDYAGDEEDEAEPTNQEVAVEKIEE